MKYTVDKLLALDPAAIAGSASPRHIQSVIEDMLSDLLDAQNLSDEKAAQQRVLAEQAEPVEWQYRWTNPGNNPSAHTDDLAWKPVDLKYWNQSIDGRIAELRAYQHAGKPCYEVRALYAHPEPASPPAPQEAQADSTPLLPVARIRSWTKHGEGHGDLVDWLEGYENLPDGEYDLYLGPQSEQKPVASIYISPNGEREFDDWKHDLPIGRNELFAAPVAQPATEQAEAPSDTLRIACITLDGSTLYIPAKCITNFGIGEDEIYTLTFKTMTRAEFDALGEFDGF